MVPFLAYQEGLAHGFEAELLDSVADFSQVGPYCRDCFPHSCYGFYGFLGCYQFFGAVRLLRSLLVFLAPRISTARVQVRANDSSRSTKADGANGNARMHTRIACRSTYSLNGEQVKEDNGSDLSRILPVSLASVKHHSVGEQHVPVQYGEREPSMIDGDVSF